MEHTTPRLPGQAAGQHAPAASRASSGRWGGQFGKRSAQRLRRVGVRVEARKGRDKRLYVWLDAQHDSPARDGDAQDRGRSSF